MFSKKNKPKLSPEQKALVEEKEREEKRRGQILKDKIYPFLVAHTESIEDAKIQLQTMGLVIEQAFMNQKRKQKVSELTEMVGEFDKDATAKRYREFYDILADEPINVAADLINSMGNIIQNNERKEARMRKLSDLAIQFINDQR